jgi:hypothetical protein
MTSTVELRATVTTHAMITMLSGRPRGELGHGRNLGCHKQLRGDFMKYVFASMLLVSGLAHGLSCTNLPVGATALGYTSQVFYDQPTLTDVSATDADATSKWYPGSFSAPVSQNMLERELLSTVDSELAVGLGAGLTSETHTSKQGALPFVSGAQGFYVEFAMHLSTNNSDHFSGLYLQTVEHNLAKSDHISTDPAGYERWTEIDVSEGGYGTGSQASLVNWEGIFPHYTRALTNSWGTSHDAVFDWTKVHRYGVSYDPIKNVLQWYIDDVPTFKATPIASVMKAFHYYLVMGAGSHGSHTPYDMYVSYVTAYTK